MAVAGGEVCGALPGGDFGDINCLSQGAHGESIVGGEGEGGRVEYSGCD